MMTFDRVQKFAQSALIAGSLLAIPSCGSISGLDYAPPQSYDTGQQLQPVQGTGNPGIPIAGPSSLPVGNAPALVSPSTMMPPYPVGLGQTQTLTVQFSGSPAPTYQWYLNGQAIPGATSSTLQLTPAKVSDYGNYYVVATNSFGNAHSYYFVINANFGWVSVGSTECNGSQCWSDAATAQKVCELTFGGQSLLFQGAFAPGYIKYTNAFCRWTGSSWSCDGNCGSSCSGANVLGSVECIQ